MTNEPVSPRFQAAFRAAAGAGSVTFARFMELALYDPDVGYYRQSKTRIGYAPGTDFFTASTSDPLFGELVSAACADLLGARDPASFSFVEIGAEKGRSVLDGVAHPFRAVRSIGIGQETDLAGRCVVFSNELFDAQPFRRFVRKNGAWRERGVALEDERLVETDLPPGPELAILPQAAEGYRIDAPFASSELLKRLASRPWTGLFLAFDYGKSWKELSQETPGGTGRAYVRHSQSNDLLAQPGDQDLTCHICWDWLSEGLAAAGFSEPVLESQEGFFVRHAGRRIEAILSDSPSPMDPRIRSIQQLLHPAHLGQKFQALHALRD